MAKTTQERSAAAASKRAARGEIILRLPTLAGTRAKLAELMAWHGFDQQAEVMTLLIERAHAMGEAGSADLFAVPRHEIEITNRRAQRLHEAVRREFEQENDL